MSVRVTHPQEKQEVWPRRTEGREDPPSPADRWLGPAFLSEEEKAN